MKAGSSLHHGASMRPPIRMPSNPNDGGWNGAERLRWSGPPLPKEETMRLVTCFEAASHNGGTACTLQRSIQRGSIRQAGQPRVRKRTVVAAQYRGGVACASRIVEQLF